MENENNLQKSNVTESNVCDSKVKKKSIKEFFKSKTVIACIIVGAVCFALGFGTSRLTMRGRFRKMMNRPGFSRNSNGNLNRGNMKKGRNGRNTQNPSNRNNSNSNSNNNSSNGGI